MDEHSRGGAFLSRPGIERTVAIRLLFVVSLVMIVGIRFERTFIALTISALFLVVFLFIGRKGS